MEIRMEKPKSDFEPVLIEEKAYRGTLKEVKDIRAGEHGERVAFVFDVETPEGTVELVRIAYKKATPKSAFTRVMKALGFPYKEGETYKSEHALGKQATVVVENYDRDGQQASIISKVKSLNEEENIGEGSKPSSV